MYNDIGGKIKGLTKAIAIIEAVIAVSIGFMMIFADDDTLFLGIVVIVIGCLAAWISSWLLYGFGELIEDTQVTAVNSLKILKIMNDNKTVATDYGTENTK